jgi:hypothetical protein
MSFYFLSLCPLSLFRACTNTHMYTLTPLLLCGSSSCAVYGFEFSGTPDEKLKTDCCEKTVNRHRSSTAIRSLEFVCFSFFNNRLYPRIVILVIVGVNKMTTFSITRVIMTNSRGCNGLDWIGLP